jgi:TBC1 domain family member 2A
MQELVVEKMPKLAEHFSNLQCDITIVATDWFLCLFCTTLPSEVSVRMV